VLPFFTAALAVAAPADPRLRAATVGAIAAGALLVSGGHVVGARLVAEAGGGLYLAGIIGLAVVAFRPLRRALGPRRRLVEVAYASAIASVAAGALLGTAFVSGAGAVLAGWGALKPAHGWLNLFGFVSLVIVATLIHLAPTVSGSRIRARRSATVAVAGLAIGTALVAAGYVVGLDAAARLGALLVIVGASAVAVHGISVRRDRGGWTSELAWHRLSEWSLLAAAGWFAVSAWIAAGRVLVLGAAPAAWRIDVFIVPLALGWIVQVLVGSWSHLLPAIGPGDAGRHTAQRRVLATWASARILGWNSGVGALAVGLPLGSPPLIGIGATLVVVTGAAHLVLFGLAALARPQVSGRGA
jgi:nitrite reductase (NO-forming)